MTDDDIQKKIADLEAELDQARAQTQSMGQLLENKLNEIYIHYHISRTISSVLDIQEMLLQIAGIIKKTIPFERMSLYLVGENRETLELSYFSGLDIKQKIILDRGAGTPGGIVESGEHLHIHDLAAFYELFDDFIHFPDEQKNGGSYIGIALKVHDTTIGAIGMDTSVQYGLSVDDMDFMAILSHQIAAGIEKSRLFEKIQGLSQRDGLTGLYNHRMFEEKLQMEINRRKRTRYPLSLIMLDIDFFKQYNDTYGHQAGDSVLKELAEIIESQSRSDSTDMCCRYGGEEFAMIMPELELHNAVKVAERLRSVVEEHAFRMNEQKSEGRVTISLGVAGISGAHEITAEEFVKKADQALYLSKRNGRNRVSYSP